jgi:phospholipase C
MAKITLRLVALLTLSTAIAAHAQWATGPTYTPPPRFSHIVFIIQENRTPDTLFGGPGLAGNPACGGWNGFAPGDGVDLANGGQNKLISACTALQSWPDLECGGGSHSHSDWEDQYDNGALDGACTKGTGSTCTGLSNEKCGNGETAPLYGPYIGIQPTAVQPYLSIINAYGWANYMFQTNQGPSFPAHQFLFSGTSAGVWPGQEYYKYFVSENPGGSTGCDVEDYSDGADGPQPGMDWITPTGKEHKVSTLTGLPTFLLDGYQCYDHNTLMTTSPSPTGTVSPSGDITWRYYAQSQGILWDAPESLTQTCYSQNGIPTTVDSAGNTVPASCGPNSTTGLDEYANVSFPVKTGANKTGAPILTDIQKCNLQQISWVTPDGAWSDHPGDDSTDKNLGPSWVADIVDAIGQSGNGGVCDYWGNNPNDTVNTSIEPTAIFIVWDDWGGFYDHVPPPGVNVGTGTAGDFSCTNSQGGNWGCGYTYGFRVPLLVVSEYTQPGTVSGALSSNTVPTLSQYKDIPTAWEHDFGSLLNFTEQNFSLPTIAPAGYSYADANTFDTTYNGKTVVPMWEFFTSPKPLGFTAISAPYPASYFESYYGTADPATGLQHVAKGADNDGDED